MNFTIAKLFGCVSIAALMVGAGCSDDETGTGGSTTTTTTTSTGGNGSGGDATGGSGGDGTGGAGGSPDCLTCGEMIVNIATANPADLCGYQGGDPMTGLMCEADSSCEVFNEFLACACGDPGCAAACGDNGCMGMSATQACITCTENTCGAENDACINDM